MTYPAGVPVQGPASVWPSCAVWADSGDSWRAVLPFGAAVAQGDVVTFNGGSWLVVDSPDSWRSPFTGWQAGVVIVVLPASMIIIERPTPSGFDGDTHRSTFVYSSVYEGAAVVPAASANASDGRSGSAPTVEGGVSATMARRSLILPGGVAARPGDRVTVTASPHASLSGAVWWVSSCDPVPTRTTLDVRDVQ